MSYFRRNSFHTAKDANTKPKWHVLVASEGYTYIAECGYRFDAILETPLTKDEVKTKALVCKKCLAGDG